jgi:CRISPR-associated endoribonuclease Cas6/Csy4 subtype I-F
MKYYIELTISSYVLLSEIISKIHNQGRQFAFYFDNVNKLRLFSDQSELLKQFGCEIKETPISVKHVRCARVRAVEKTAIQQAKRLERFKKHLYDKGVSYDENHARKTIKADFDYYINIQSQGSKQNYRVYVKNTIVYKEKTGRFSSYGLSLDGTTVHLF